MGRITAPLQRDITQAGLNVTVGTLLLSSGCLARLGIVVVKLVRCNCSLVAAWLSARGLSCRSSYVKMKRASG